MARLHPWRRASFVSRLQPEAFDGPIHTLDKATAMADQAGMPPTACRAVAEPFDTHRRWRSVWLVPCAAGLSAGQPLREDASCECGRSVSPRSHCPLGTASAQAADADDASTMGSDQIRHPPRDRCGILGEAERARTGEGEQASRSQPSELRRYPQQPHLNGRCIEGTSSGANAQ